MGQNTWVKDPPKPKKETENEAKAKGAGRKHEAARKRSGGNGELMSNEGSR
jgi:hypothetical protein